MDRFQALKREADEKAAQDRAALEAQEAVIAQWQREWLVPLREIVQELKYVLQNTNCTVEIEDGVVAGKLLPPGGKLCKVKIAYVRDEKPVDSIEFDLETPTRPRSARVSMRYKGREEDAYFLGAPFPHIANRLEQFVRQNLHRS